MNKKTLAEVLAKRNNIPYEAAYNNVDAMLDIISSSIQEGIAVKLRGFGTFTMRERRSGIYSDSTGHQRRVRAVVRAHFKPSQFLRRQIGDGP